MSVRHDRPPRFSGIHVRQMDARLSLFPTERGSLVLPDLILWAFQLNEGDLLTLSRLESETFRCHAESYAQLLRTLADWGPTVHWRFIEEKLRLPMAAVAPQGKLLLSEEAAPLAEPGNPILLSVPPPAGGGFILEPAGGRRISARLFLEVTYTLPLEEGVRVRIPDDLLWASGLQEGDELVCKTSLGQADFEPFAHAFSLDGRTLVQLGPRGALLVPDSFLRHLMPGWRILLTATFKPLPNFRFNYDVE